MKNTILTILLGSLLSISPSFGQPGPGERLGDKPGIKKPDGAGELDKPTARISKESIQETQRALREGKIKPKQAAAKIKEIRDGLKEKGELEDIKRAARPELSDELKGELDAIKEKRDALHAAFKETLEDLGKDATKEERMQAVEEFKEANKEKHQEIKAQYEAIREKIKESRPERPERPVLELSDELKADLQAIKEKREELHEAQKALHEKLKNASAEDRKAMIAEFKDVNKEKHKEIKEKSKALKQQVREQIETEETRTSDL